MAQTVTSEPGPRILFVCIENAGRSQIARALYTAMSGGFGEARSAGTKPAERIHPHVAAELAERGLYRADLRPRRLELEDAAWADRVITMGCGDQCPATGKPTEDWALPDPNGMSASNLAQLIDEIEIRVAELLDRLGRHGRPAKFGER